MRKLLYLIACLTLCLSFQDGKDNKVNKIWDAQIKYLEGEEFAKIGITGKGIRIAILDGGFPGTDTHPALKNLIVNKQIKATWNFVKNCENVYSGVPHGTAVLSCIAGIIDGKRIGMAPDAEFLLALTEKNGEPLSEELNWARAVDWAIDHGANIIQSSLGYTHQRYFTSDLDGKHSICAKAAARAARKGILIINCMGNEGRSKWQTMVTPADADSILSVGAIDPTTGLAAGFSSVGPTADKRLKPNVCASGTVVAANSKGGVHIMDGTSFSTPLITGFAACVWQLHRSFSAQEILALIEKSGHLYPFYDYSHGYGIPQASRIIGLHQNITPQTLKITSDDKNYSISIPANMDLTDSFLPDQYLYYHFSEPSGYLIKYGVYRAKERDTVFIRKPKSETGLIFRCSYHGETATWKETR